MPLVEEKAVAMQDPCWGPRIVESMVNGHPCRVYEVRPKSLAALLLDSQRWEDREFLVQGSRRITGREHFRAVARIAAHLRKKCARAGDRIMLLAFNQIEWLTAFWAIQCVGATAVLGNAWWSDQELEDAIELAHPSLILSDRASHLPLHHQPKRITLAEVRQWAEEEDDPELVLGRVEEDADALVIFSSGTTGQPKGVVMSHRSVIANIQSLLMLTGRLPSELAHTHPGTVSLLTMPLFHLAGIQISFMTMLSGGKVVFPAGRFDPLEVLQLIKDERVRAWGSVPTMVSRVVRHPDFARYDTSSLSSIPMGGAAIPHDLKEELRRAFPKTDKRVGSMYGLTEAGGVLAAGSGADVEHRPNCVGRPLPAVEVRIRNPNAEGVGEIVARTPTATSGYLGDVTAICDEQGWIASGDLGYLDAEGFLYVVGRLKDIIIRGGENIACVHVESCLRSHPEVLEVAVVALPHPDLGEEVAAAVVLKSGAHADEALLKAHALTRLAKFEVPSRWWLRRDPLPTNASGKIVKRELIQQWPEAA